MNYTFMYHISCINFKTIIDLLLVIMTKSLHPQLKTLSLISSGSIFPRFKHYKTHFII